MKFNYGITQVHVKAAEEYRKKEGIREQLMPARVVQVHREAYRVANEWGESSAKLKGSAFYYEENDKVFPAVGDYVLIHYNPIGDSIIYDVLPRISYFSRLDPSTRQTEQIIASNFDYVFIMSSLNNNFSTGRIERYVTAAWQSNAIPVVVLTKSDLVDDISSYIAKASMVAPGVDVWAISTINKQGLDELELYVQEGKTIVLLGSSGIGKSSLVNALAGEEIMNTNGIREEDSKGYHTTTHRQMIMLNKGAMIIDTPGMRELGMWDVSEGLKESFEDIEEIIMRCRFNNCNHGNEPGCAIQSALKDGTITLERYKSYVKLQKESRMREQKEVLKQARISKKKGKK